MKHRRAFRCNLFEAKRISTAIPNLSKKATTINAVAFLFFYVADSLCYFVFVQEDGVCRVICGNDKLMADNLLQLRSCFGKRRLQ